MAQTVPPIMRPITARAADNGIYIGVYLCVLVLAIGFSATVPLAGLLLWGGSLFLPVFMYRLLRKSNISANGGLGFAELWAEGIASFSLGTLFPALLVYGLLRFVAPTFIADTLAGAVEYFEAQGTAEWDAWAENLRGILAGSRMPTAVDVAARLISFNIVVGTVLSMVTAVIVKVAGRRFGSFGRFDNN